MLHLDRLRSDMQENVTSRPQVDSEDLGEKMCAALAEVLNQGCAKVPHHSKPVH
jgi:hypothetical protein